MKRERLGTIGIGNGVAIPHAKYYDIRSIYIVLAILSEPIGFDAIDDRPVDIVFTLVAPESSGADHLRLLGRLSKSLRAKDGCANLRGAMNIEECSRILDAVGFQDISVQIESP